MGFFSENSKFMRFMEKFVDVLLLNLLWLLFSLPIVTIGAATVAAFSVSLKLVDDEESYLFRSFLKAFKDNFRQGTILWLINAVAIYALYLDWQLVTGTPDPSILLIIVGILSLAMVFLAFVYAYPQVARYHNKLRRTIENSVRICFRYPGRTALLLLVVIVEIGLFIWNNTMMLFGILIGPMIIIYTVSGMAKRIFLELDQKRES